jgi:hypothetical protein
LSVHTPDRRVAPSAVVSDDPRADTSTGAAVTGALDGGDDAWEDAGCCSAGRKRANARPEKVAAPEIALAITLGLTLEIDRISMSAPWMEEVKLAAAHAPDVVTFRLRGWLERSATVEPWQTLPEAVGDDEAQAAMSAHAGVQRAVDVRKAVKITNAGDPARTKLDVEAEGQGQLRGLDALADVG